MSTISFLYVTLFPYCWLGCMVQVRTCILTQCKEVSHVAARVAPDGFSCWSLISSFSMALLFGFCFYLLFRELCLGPCFQLYGCLFFSGFDFWIGFSNMFRALCHYAPGLMHWNGGRAERQGRAIFALIAAVRTFSLALVLSACHSR